MSLISVKAVCTLVVSGLTCVWFWCNWRIQSLQELFALTRTPGPREEPVKPVFQPHTSSPSLTLWQLTVVVKSLESSFYHSVLWVVQPAIIVKGFSWVYGNRDKKFSQGILSGVEAPLSETFCTSSVLPEEDYCLWEPAEWPAVANGGLRFRSPKYRPVLITIFLFSPISASKTSQQWLPHLASHFLLGDPPSLLGCMAEIPFSVVCVSDYNCREQRRVKGRVDENVFHWCLSLEK